jgi:hypothetical protein
MTRRRAIRWWWDHYSMRNRPIMVPNPRRLTREPHQGLDPTNFVERWRLSLPILCSLQSHHGKEQQCRGWSGYIREQVMRAQLKKRSWSPRGFRSYSCAGAASTGGRSWAARGTRARRLWHVDPAKQSHSERADSGMTTWDPGVSGSQRKQRSRLGCAEGDCGAGTDWRQSAQLGVYSFFLLSFLLSFPFFPNSNFNSISNFVAVCTLANYLFWSYQPWWSY